MGVFIKININDQVRNAKMSKFLWINEEFVEICGVSMFHWIVWVNRWKCFRMITSLKFGSKTTMEVSHSAESRCSVLFIWRIRILLSVLNGVNWGATLQGFSCHIFSYIHIFFILCVCLTKHKMLWFCTFNWYFLGDQYQMFWLLGARIS